jgi:RNA polymerase sigma factor (sigma-70 family)
MELTGFRDLVLRVTVGDPGATEELEVRLGPYLAGMVRRHAGPGYPDQSITDWVQEVWLRLLKKCRQFKGADQAASDQDVWNIFRRWVRTLVRRALGNIQRDHARHEPRAPQRKVALHVPRPDGSTSGDCPLEPAGSDPTPSRIVADKETLQRLSTALDQLPVADRELVRLHFLEGKTWQEIAAACNRTLAQVKHRYRQILGQLRSNLGWDNESGGPFGTAT